MYAQGTNLTSYFTCPWKIISQKVLKFSVVAILCKHKGGQLTQHFLCVSKCLCFQIFGEWKPSMCMMWICFWQQDEIWRSFRKSRCFGFRHTFKSKLITLKKKVFNISVLFLTRRAGLFPLSFISGEWDGKWNYRVSDRQIREDQWHIDCVNNNWPF